MCALLQFYYNTILHVMHVPIFLVLHLFSDFHIGSIKERIEYKIISLTFGELEETTKTSLY